MEKNDFLKDYIQVNQRIIKFYEKYPEGSIQTEMLLVDNEKVIMKAFAYKSSKDLRPSIGHAEEIRNSNYINRTSAVENCETSAVGRALANMGFEIKHSIASKEEVQRSIEKRSFLEGNMSPVEREKKEVFTRAKEKGLSDAQFKTVCQNITNKESSKLWTEDDIKNINNYINLINTNLKVEQ